MPNSCVFCGGRLDLDAAPVCDGCYSDLPWIAHSCSRCGCPVAAPLPDGIPCGRCQIAPLPFEVVVTPLHYRFPVDAAIKAFKFHRKLHYGSALASILVDAVPTLPAGIDGLLPVPLHWRRQAMRGFNQARELCAPVQRLLDAHIVEGVGRTRPTPSQSGLDSGARQRNLRTAFRAQGRIAARHVLIVDDVVTTGATCRQLATVLLDAGVGQVSVLAVARAAMPD